MAEVGETIVNPATGEQVTFRTTSETTGGEKLETVSSRQSGRPRRRVES
jgi:hypothetical protein